MRTRTLIELAIVVVMVMVACGPEPLATNHGTMAVDAATLDAQLALATDAGDTSVSQAGMSAQNPAPEVVGTLAPEFLADAGQHWLRLIATSWELAAGHDDYLCVLATVPRDAYLHEFSPLTSRGTHHSVLVVYDSPIAPDGVSVCDVDRSGRQIYDSNDFTAGAAGHLLLPDGIAVRVRAGQQIELNLHLLNSSNERWSGTSGLLVRTLEEAQVKNVAQTVLAGPGQLRIPTGSVQLQAQCPLPHDATIFAVAPHMHELGTYMKVVAQSASAGDVVLFDGRYSFDWQQVYLTNFVKVQAGDIIHVECNYENSTQHTVGFGHSNQDEMCFVALSLFPPGDETSYPCTE
jgi:hypothetical protein